MFLLCSYHLNLPSGKCYWSFLVDVFCGEPLLQSALYKSCVISRGIVPTNRFFLGIQSPCQMIGVCNHLQNAMYLVSITILRRCARIPRAWVSLTCSKQMEVLFGRKISCFQGTQPRQWPRHSYHWCQIPGIVPRCSHNEDESRAALDKVQAADPSEDLSFNIYFDYKSVW